MNNFFQFVMYVLVGRRWIVWDMLQGVKMALFANEMELKMLRDKLRKSLDAELEVKNEIQALEAVDPLADLPEDANYKDKKTAEEAHENKIKEAKERLQMKHAEVDGMNGEIGRLNNIVYHNRLKYDFLRSYDVSKHKGYQEIQKEIEVI